MRRTIEKLPVTPGPIVPAREQLGDLLLEQNHAGLALKEFETAIANAPGRCESVLGAALAAETLRQEIDCIRGGSGDYFQGSRHGIFVSSCHATIPVT